MTIQYDDAAAIPSTGFRFTSADGLAIACTQWASRGPERGVVQIAHGMEQAPHRAVPCRRFTR